MTSILRIATIFLASILLIQCQTNQEEQVDSATNDSSIEVFLLAVYHFHNPGMDKYNLEIDDYLSEERQSQLLEVNDRLADFRPTKVMVEHPASNCELLDSLYNNWADGVMELNEIEGAANEIIQLGFRTAREMELPGVNCIDEGGQWLGSYVDFIADTFDLDFYREREIASLEKLESDNARLAEQTVLENLIYTNQWENILDNHDYYNRFAVRVQDTVGIYFTNQEVQQEIDGLPYSLMSYDFENIGVELVSLWYKRNLMIYRNILEQAEAGDRLLIIYGQGHVRYLHQMLDDHPEFNVVDPVNYLQ